MDFNPVSSRLLSIPCLQLGLIAAETFGLVKNHRAVSFRKTGIKVQSMFRIP